MEMKREQARKLYVMATKEAIPHNQESDRFVQIYGEHTLEGHFASLLMTTIPYEAGYKTVVDLTPLPISPQIFAFEQVIVPHIF